MLVAIARIFQLRTPFEELEDQLIGLAPHGAREAAVETLEGGTSLLWSGGVRGVGRSSILPAIPKGGGRGGGLPCRRLPRASRFRRVSSHVLGHFSAFTPQTSQPQTPNIIKSPT